MEFTNSKENIWVVGHRGAKDLYPENTMISFQNAIRLGVDGIETDVRMTKDGLLVLIHDKTVNRTTNGTGLVADFTYEELLKLDAGERFSKEYTGARIPTFMEFLQIVPRKNFLLNIEIKDFREEVLVDTLALLENQGFADSFVIACFDADITTLAHEKYHVRTQGFPLSLVRNAGENTEKNYYSSGIGMVDLTPEICADYVRKSIDPWCWCPDTEEEVKRAVACGATLCTCNNPIPALNYLRSVGLHP